MKRILSFVLALLLALGSAQPASAQDAFVPEDVPMTGDSILFSISENGTIGGDSMLGASKPLGEGRYEQWSCESLSDPECAVPTKAETLGGSTILGPCDSAAAVNCIEEFSIGLAGQELQQAEFTGRPDGIKIAADPSVGHPGGGTSTLWRAEHAPSESGTVDYSLNLQVNGSIDARNPNRKWTFGSMSVNVFPYRLLEGERYKTAAQFTNVRADGTRGFAIGGHSLECAWSDAGRCGRQQNFAEGTTVRVVVRVSKQLGGWFRGRMQDPTIGISSFNKDFNRITVQAETVTIGRIAHIVEREKMSPKEKTLLAQGSGGIKYGTGHWHEASTRGVFDYLNYFKPKVNDTLSGLNRVWNFGTVQAGGGSRCLDDSSRVLGIVTTNAMGFDGASPAYSRGSLNYNVGGLHYNPDGETEFEGSYDLVMRSDVARCLYGLTKAPVSATITVSGEGDKSIATTVVSEKNGWLKLAAYGFTFSNKTIKVKLTQKKTTITCIAPGKKSKKVTATNPKCPKGFKKR